MGKVLNIYTPIRTTISPDGGTLTPGDTVTIDTNVPATVIYTIDGSEPKVGSFGTFRGEAPVSIELRVPARLRYRAVDNRQGQSANATKTREASFDMTRTNALEAFRDTSNFFRRLVNAIVDQNFYLTEGSWLVPVGARPFTFLFVNRETFSVRLRVLHNGVDVFSQFPLLAANETKEIPIRPISGENTIQVETQRRGTTAFYDEGSGYDVDVYA